jgi:TonB family protein
MSDSWKECEGQAINGEFRLLEHLGGSDHSVVFLTERGKGEPQKAAIKFIQADPATAEKQLTRWKQAAQLAHPNLLKLFETGRCQLAGMDLLYVVMEHASENLADFLPQRALSPGETRDMLEPFVDTLAYLHGKGFLHGGIKPRNILAIDDQLKLSGDSIRRVGEARFGSAKVDAYTPPESTSGENSEAGDIWSLGVTLVETLTQRVPDGVSSSEAGELSLPDSLTEPFLDIALHSLARRPQQRWSVAQISARLNPKAVPPPSVASAQNLPAAAKPAPTPQPAARPAQAAPPPKPPAPIDPLSVPLSTVGPRQGLDGQIIGGKRPPARGYYIVFAVLLALTLGAMLAIPRFRGRQTEPEPARNTPSNSATPAKSQPKTRQKQNTTGTDKPSQHSELEPQEDLAPDSMQATVEKQPMRKDQPASSTSAAPAALRSAAPRSSGTPAPPFVPNRDARIAAGAVTPGEVLNQVLPEISGKSRTTIRGTVRTIIKVHVDSSGDVTGAEIAAGASKFFANAALEAVQLWDFAPAKVDGHAVPSEWLVHFDFTQTDTKVTPLATKP